MLTVLDFLDCDSVYSVTVVCEGLEFCGRKHIVTLGRRSELLSTPFGARSFGDEVSNRKSIEFQLAPDSVWLAYFTALDEWAVPYIALHRDRLFKKRLAVEQVLESYKPRVSRRGTYPATVRCKINVGDSGAVRCWSALDQRVAIPEDLRGYGLLPRMHISHMWITNRECGFVVNRLDLQCIEDSTTCPFMEE